MDLLLDSSGDLAFVDGDFVAVTGPEEVRQRLDITLSVERGSWLLNTLFGVPYRDEVLVKAPRLQGIDAMLKSIIAGVEGVDRLISYSSSLEDRLFTVNFEVLTLDGEEVPGSLTADPDGAPAGGIVVVQFC